MQSISDLNKKVWYRLVKVIFLLLCSLILITALVITYFTKLPYQTEDYKITCIGEVTNNKTFWAQDESVYVRYDFQEFGGKQISVISEYSKDSINEKCGVNKTVAKANDEHIFDIIFDIKGVYKKYSKEDKEKLLDKYTIYKIEKHNVQKGKLRVLVSWLLIVLSLTLLTFEVLRRTFYYIILGKIFPIK